MKILQINTTVGTGSTGRIAEEIDQTLQKYGHESYVAYNKSGPNTSGNNYLKIGNKLDVYLHGIKTRMLDAHGFGSKKVTEEFIKKVQKIDPDVIGLHNLHGYYLNIEILFDYLKEKQKPVLWTLHDCWPFTGHCSFFDYVNCDKWKTECYDCPLSDKYPASWFLDRSTENFHRKKEIFNGLENLTIVTPSHWLKDIVSQSFLSHYPVMVIHNGIDTTQFNPLSTERLKEKYNLFSQKVLLGIASVWDRRKGLNYFLELSKYLDEGYKIVLIGLSAREQKQLPENIIGIQRTENIDELVQWYNAADVFVNPTLVDNFPTTNLEALACGTPVVTFDTGGSPEAIDENTGIVVPKGDTKGLRDAISEILTWTSKFDQQKCRDRATELFNKEDRFRDYVNLYEEKQMTYNRNERKAIRNDKTHTA